MTSEPYDPASGAIGVEVPGGDPLQKDAAQLKPGFGRGGVPWPLLLLYLGFLVFFTWYTMNFQLPGFVDQGPGSSEEAPVDAATGSSDETDG